MIFFVFRAITATNTCLDLDRMEEISQLAKWLDSQLPSLAPREELINMETTVPFGRAISVRQLPFAVLSDNVF